MFARGGELVADEAKPEQPAAEGVFGVVGLRAMRAGARTRERLVGDRHAQLDVSLYLARVKRRVEGAELDRPLLEHAVQVEQVVAAGVVVLVRVALPVGCAVPEPRERCVAGGLRAVEPCQEGLVDFLAPAVAAFGRDLECLRQQVFLGVDDVDQVAQGFRGVRAATNVDVDAAGWVGLRAGLAQRTDDGLHGFNIFPAANRADELRAFVAGARDTAVRNDLPLPACGVEHTPCVVHAALVLHAAAKMCGNDLRRLGARDAVHLDLDTEGLGFHGFRSFRRAVFPPATHSSLRSWRKASNETLI